MNASYRTRTNGLMRCCLKTIDDAMQMAKTPPQDGDTLSCTWCGAPMVFQQGAWQHDHPRDAA